MKKKKYQKICGIFFVASPSKSLKNAAVGGCLLGYRGITKRMCENCEKFNTRNYIAEGVKILENYKLSKKMTEKGDVE